MCNFVQTLENFLVALKDPFFHLVSKNDYRLFEVDLPRRIFVQHQNYPKIGKNNFIFARHYVKSRFLP